MKRLIAISILGLVATLPAAATTDATGPNTWISVGIPNRLHVGTNGDIFVEGSDHGRCNNVRPDYFRLDMSQPHFKDLYAALLVAAANGTAVDCVVDSACGTSQVWVHYCRIPLR